MKKVFSIFLILLLVLVMGSYCFATEVADSDLEGIDNAETNSEENSENADISVAEQEESEENEEKMKILQAKVVELEEIERVDVENDPNKEMYEYYYGVSKYMNVQTVKVEVIDEGDNKGKVFTIQEIVEADGKIYSNFKVGQLIFITENGETIEDGSSLAYKITEKRNSTLFFVLLITIIVFVGLTILKGLKTIGLIIINLIIVITGIYCLYNGIIPLLAILAIVSILMVVSNVLILNKINKQSFVIIGAVILSTVLTTAILFVLNNILGLNGNTLYSYNYKMADKIVIYKDIITYSLIVASIGIAIKIAIKSSNEMKQEDDILKVFKKVGEKITSDINMMFIAWLGFFTAIFIPIYSSVDTRLLMNYEDIVLEIVKLLIIIINVILVIPVSTILSKEMLFKKKTIAEGKIENNEMKDNSEENK